MTPSLIKLSTLSIIILLTNNIFANEETKKNPIIIKSSTKPVDEADKLKPKKDKIKGGEKLKDKAVKHLIKLSDIKEHYQIKRSGLHFPPYRCFIYSNGKEIEIGVINKKTIDFKIKQSLLKIGDIILVTNKLDIQSKSPIKKVIIEEIEVK